MNITVFWSNRSEYHLLAPVVEALNRKFDVTLYQAPDDPKATWDWLGNLDDDLPDCAIIPFDRPPMAAIAFVAYHLNVPIAQLHAGDISTGTWDDMDRWCITAWATYHFCAGKDQAARVRKFLRLTGRPKEDWRVYAAGATHLDDIDKMTEPPDGDYDVVMYNPPTKGGSPMNDISQIVNLIDKQTYWIEPNGDPGSNDVQSRVRNIALNKSEIEWTPTLTHCAMLGLLSRAKRVIGNSSALFFEAPYFGCEIIQIGERNRIRENVTLFPGAGKRIASRLASWLI